MKDGSINISSKYTSKEKYLIQYLYYDLTLATVLKLSKKPTIAKKLTPAGIVFIKKKKISIATQLKIHENSLDVDTADNIKENFESILSVSDKEIITKVMSDHTYTSSAGSRKAHEEVFEEAELDII